MTEPDQSRAQRSKFFFCNFSFYVKGETRKFMLRWLLAYLSRSAWDSSASETLPPSVLFFADFKASICSDVVAGVGIRSKE